MNYSNPMRYIHLLLITLFIYSNAGSQIIQPATQPMLRLNTDMHTAIIHRLSSDKKGKTVLTCSDDKTAKLWDAKTGALIRTLRIPMDQGNEGMLYACALSPDGKIAAVGGWTGGDWFNEYSIYLLSTQTGEMIKRLSGMESNIHDLKFSQDGGYLASGLMHGKGVWIFNTNTWTVEKILSGYLDNANDIAFDREGKMASACDDGKIRLYSSSFELIDSLSPTGGTRPFSLCFSHDGKLLAVGYADSARLQVLDANKLSVLYEPDIKDANTVDKRFDHVTFSNNGKYLYAGGFYQNKEGSKYLKQIRRWDKAGRGKYIDFSACPVTIQDLKPMPDNSIIYCGGKPDFGRISSDGDSIFYNPPETNDFNKPDNSHLKVNEDGSLIGFTPFLTKAITFSLNKGELTEKQCNEPSFKDQVDNLKVTDWQNNYSPKLNGKTLSFLRQKERCISVDVSQPRNLIFGANFFIYCLDTNGQTRWKTLNQASVWAVKISGNEKVVVAAVGNGVINWYRMSDGKKILSLFTHPDKKRWILWTPSGYYKCSAGAEDLVGWHVNNGADQAAGFYPMSKFRNVYYRPDVIDKILQTQDEDEALRLADLESNISSRKEDIIKRLPPTITINSPLNGTNVSSTAVTVKYSVKSPNNKPILSIRALIDGNLFKDTTISKMTGDSGIFLITIHPQNCKVTLIARNEFGFSEPAEITLNWQESSREENDNWRPGVIMNKLLRTRDKYNDLLLADLDTNSGSLKRDGKQRLTPTITIASPFNGTEVSSTEVNIKYIVTSPDNKPVLSISAYIDGVLFKDYTTPGQAAETGKITITIPMHNCKISLMARNESGFSDPFEITLNWKGSTGEEKKPMPNMYILAIGISDYDKPDLKLGLAAKDAKDFCSAFQKQKGLLYSDVTVKLLTDKFATLNKIQKGLDWLIDTTTDNDIAVIFLAGHGMNKRNMFYFLPVGSDPEEISTTGLVYSNIQNTIGALHGKKLVFIDACHAGNVMGGLAPPDINNFVNGLITPENGAFVFASCTTNQTSMEKTDWGNGAFTKFLVEGINGKARGNTGKITVKSLDLFISDMVTELTENKQTPVTSFTKGLPNLEIAKPK